MSGDGQQDPVAPKEPTHEQRRGEGGLFYGWAVVGALVVITAMVVGLAGANIAVFIEPMTRELGWSPAAFGWAQMARLETVIIAGPVLGRSGSWWRCSS
jgi:NAD/NADP transhydrogenase beta subunit